MILRRKVRPCSECGEPPQFGYSDHAESNHKDIRPLCLNCMVARMNIDYGNFNSEAVVVQPCPGPPVYVFQEAAGWQQYFKDSKISEDVRGLLAKISEECHDCGGKSKFVWVESQGLTAHNFVEVLDRGITATLLRDNPEPMSLCAKCCVSRISRNLAGRDISYLEVCSPVGTAPGFVLPMGY